ncbi:MAG: peptide chain release factor 1 [Acetobacter sp.]|nr:peptide chain release factor 1 [Acetobacter sp.]MBO6086396.1 peptide chain release factor 1 [Acetobacter sp.]MBQ5497683.1 peptide chain release factor 1 [Acetobacter sp.]MBQ5515731.1 peptide chain release factor 1 [Acetobacter sp.]MBQ5546718.1 peptide chain release factor 1 [Acetobacter sp.]
MTLNKRLDQIVNRALELEALLASGVEGEALVQASREYADLEDIVRRINALRALEQEIEQAQQLLADPEMQELAKTELEELQERLPWVQKEVRLALLPKNAVDERSAILEVRPAAGGDEAMLFAAEIFDLYRRYAEIKGWRFSLMEYDESELGGLRCGIAEINGRGVFACLKYESGVHRVQRVPTTESQGRIHTSTVTVAVLPDVEDVEVEINDSDLRIDVFRASGAGGQHVNKTESAVRVTHMPSGIVVSMQEEKSQHKNRAKAMKVLRARLYEREREQAHASRAADRRSQVGTGDRSERIRTYNFPQGRVTDHRINLTLYKIDRVMLGEIEEFVEALTQEEQATLLAEAGL